MNLNHYIARNIFECKNIFYMLKYKVILTIVKGVHKNLGKMEELACEWKNKYGKISDIRDGVHCCKLYWLRLCNSTQYTVTLVFCICFCNWYFKSCMTDFAIIFSVWNTLKVHEIDFYCSEQRWKLDHQLFLICFELHASILMCWHKYTTTCENSWDFQMWKKKFVLAFV